VTTVRSQAKADKIKEAHPKATKDQLDFAIVEDIAQPNAFNEAVKSNPPFEAVIHTASPFHFNAKDIQKVSESPEYPIIILICIGSARSGNQWNSRVTEGCTKPRINCKESGT